MMPNARSTLSLVATVALFGTAACGSGDGSSGNAGAATKPGTATAANACGISSPFAGDENCIPAPAESEGFQLHIGPDVADYANPDPMWVMQPGQEITECYYMNTPNTDAIYYFEQQYRMRPGSHHMIIQLDNSNAPDGWGPCEGSILGAIGGTQHQVEDFPPNGVVAPEDQGLARELQPATRMSIQLHFYNSTSAPTLREAWVNFLYKDKADVTQTIGELGGFAPVNVPPHTSATTGATCDEKDSFPPAGATGERVVALFGHVHAHNTRFVVYRDKPDGTSDIVYDMYDWEESPTYIYNSMTNNPAPDPTAKTTGAYTGDLVLNPGEKLRFQCDITNTLNTTLVPTNAVFTGEMCDLFGTVVGAGFPCFSIAGQ